MSADYLDDFCYLDTTIFVYMFDKKNQEKRSISDNLYRNFLASRKGRISVQVISEWRNVMYKKYADMIDTGYRRQFIVYLSLLNPLAVTPDIILAADRLLERYKLSPYDSIHVQCALNMGCRYLLTEDMQHGLLINRRLRILNPYIQ